MINFKNHLAESVDQTQLAEAFNTAPYETTFGKKSAGDVYFTFTDEDDKEFRIQFYTPQGLGKGVRQVFIGQKKGASYLDANQKFKNPMKVIATMIDAMQQYLKTPLGQSVDGYALNFSKKAFDRGQKLIPKIIRQSGLKQKLNVMDLNFSPDDSRGYIWVIKKGKDPATVFDGPKLKGVLWDDPDKVGDTPPETPVVTTQGPQASQVDGEIVVPQGLSPMNRIAFVKEIKLEKVAALVAAQNREISRENNSLVLDIKGVGKIYATVITDGDKDKTKISLSYQVFGREAGDDLYTQFRPDIYPSFKTAADAVVSKIYRLKDQFLTPSAVSYPPGFDKIGPQKTETFSGRNAEMNPDLKKSRLSAYRDLIGRVSGKGITLTNNEFQFVVTVFYNENGKTKGSDDSAIISLIDDIRNKIGASFNQGYRSPTDLNFIAYSTDSRGNKFTLNSKVVEVGVLGHGEQWRGKFYANIAVNLTSEAADIGDAAVANLFGAARKAAASPRGKSSISSTSPNDAVAQLEKLKSYGKDVDWNISAGVTGNVTAEWTITFRRNNHTGAFQQYRQQINSANAAMVSMLKTLKQLGYSTDADSDVDVMYTLEIAKDRDWDIMNSGQGGGGYSEYEQTMGSILRGSPMRD